MRRHLHEALHNTGDRGSVSLWVVIFAFVTLALLILIVDGGQVIVAKSRAADIAQKTTQFQGALNNMKILAEGGTVPPAPARP